MITVWQADDLVIEVDVTAEATGAPFDMTGGTGVCTMKQGLAVVTGSTVVAGSVVTCTWGRATLSPGPWLMQVLVTVGPKRQTVIEQTVTVLSSNVIPA